MIWIRVEEKYPPDSSSDRVLAFGRHSCKACPQTIQIQFCTYTKKRGFEVGEYDCSFDATHWMALPQPPEEK
jgi:hypothetical protein